MNGVNDGAIKQRLRDRNPWWRSDASDPCAWVQQDQALIEAERNEIGHRPAVLDDVGPDGLYVLRGPRRVGKSVALKRLVVRLVNEGVRPRNIIHLPLDDFTTQDLRRVLVVARDMAGGAESGARYWLLDEVTSVDGWTKVIKEARDNTDIARDAMVLTGSSSADLALAVKDLGAGRAGVTTTNRFRLLLPMSFRDYVAVTLPDIPLPDEIGAHELQSPAAASASQQLEPWVNELDLAWQRFLDSGGFPRAVAEYGREGEVGAGFCEDLRSWLTADAAPGEQPDAITATLSEIAERTASPFDTQDFGDAIGLGRTAAGNRLNRLQASAALIACPSINAKGEPIHKAQPKLYLVDPLLARIPHLLESGFPPPDVTRLSEAALAIALARAADRLHPGRFLSGRAIGYTRTGTAGNEIDFGPTAVRVAGVDQWTTPVESKWVTSGWRRDSKVLRGKFGAGVVATKDITDVTEGAAIWAVPAPVVAVLLG